LSLYLVPSGRERSQPDYYPPNAAQTEIAVLAGGCFWGQQGLFAHVKGVSMVVAGYSGGQKATAFYKLVQAEWTGHAESVEITFDPRVISFGQLLQIYFSVAHDPTQLNRQDMDRGTSYRSEIFSASKRQDDVSRAYVAQLEATQIFAPYNIATRIEPLKGFYDAEGYHQDYLFYNTGQPYIVQNDLPKIWALKKVWPQYYRDKPVRFTGRRADPVLDSRKS
jgi:peptide-methionine (S)-S-oxide reductase